MNKTIRNILLISAIIPATILFGFSVMFMLGIFSEISEGYFSIFIILSLLLGAAGYFGLWRNIVIDEVDNKTSNLLLIFGALSYLIFFTLNDIGTIEKIGELCIILIVFWPCVVAIIILIDNFIQIKNRRNT